MKLKPDDILVDESDRWIVESGFWWLAHEERHGGIVTGKLQKREPSTSLGIMLMGPPCNLVVDHINRDPLDNRRKNLRIITNHANNINRYSHNTSWNKTCYRVHVKYKDKRYFKSGFKTFEEAVAHAKIIKLQFLIQELESTRHLNPHLLDNEYYQLV